jgi:hypothetical protein
VGQNADKGHAERDVYPQGVLTVGRGGAEAVLHEQADADRDQHQPEASATGTATEADEGDDAAPRPPRGG